MSCHRRLPLGPLSPVRRLRTIPSAILGILPLLLVGGPVRPAAAQELSDWRAPRWVGDATFLGSNALLGGLTAGVLQSLRGGDFRDGFTRGALGGATAYVGRRVAVERFDGAGLVGRQISSVGGSIVRNAAEGRPSLEMLVLSFAPVRLYIDRSDGWEVLPRITLRDLVWLVSFAAREETEFDLAATLSSGAPVFRSPMRSFIDGEGASVDGVHSGGVIGLSDVPTDLLRSAFAHERVHVLQHDFALLLWSDPVERRILASHPLTARLYRHLEPGVAFPGLRHATYHAFGVEHARQPAEIEAMFLDRRPR